MVREDGSLVTDDMCQAIVLIINGYHPVMEFGDTPRSVVWVIPEDEVDEFVGQLIDEYEAGGHRVEPRRFLRESRDVRQRMYRFLGIGDRAQGTPIRRGGSSS